MLLQIRDKEEHLQAIETPGQAQTVLSGLYLDMGRCINASQPGLCPVDMSLNFLRLCHAQICGKCVPCRIAHALKSAIDQRLLPYNPAGHVELPKVAHKPMSILNDKQMDAFLSAVEQISF